MIIIGLDDTDTLETRGTGHLARTIAEALAADYPVAGVVRHQLLVDPQVPYTSHNSSAAILVDAEEADPSALMERVETLMLADFVPGSDPGLCVAAWVPPEIMAFGRRAKREIVTQQEARDLAETHRMALVGLGGTNGGMIGALAAVGLAASGEDGRYVQVGRSRDVAAGLVSIPAILQAGIEAVQPVAGGPLREGAVLVDKLRPARRGSHSVLFVEWSGEHWLPLKLD